jgi:hypothetical protein
LAGRYLEKDLILKKYKPEIIFFYIFLIGCISVYAQTQGDYNIKIRFDECINLLDKKLPSTGFYNFDEYTYRKIDDNNIYVTVFDDIIFSTFISETFINAGDADKFVNEFLDYFDDNNWRYDKDIGDQSIYVKDNLCAMVTNLFNSDNTIIIKIEFIKTT